MPSTVTTRRTRSKVSRRLRVLAAAALVAGGLAGATTPAHAEAGPGSTGLEGLPAVSGPLPDTASSHAFGAAAYENVPEDLAKSGYTDGEYTVSGTANVYDWPKPGPAVVRTPDAPYTTRMLVRRPADPKKFSGRVVVEMLNPSSLFDLNIGWAHMHRQLVRNGDAWVGITVKPTSMQALKNFDPQRYKDLSLANPLPLSDPRNCAKVPADSSRATENGLAWDIYAQVGRLMHSTSAANPLSYDGRTTVRQVYGFGYSQTGGYLYNWINGVRPIADKANGGRPIYDGYLIAGAGGSFVGMAPINQCATVPPAGDPRYQLKNVGVPVIHVMTQSDYLTGIDSRRSDSDAPKDRYRHYEMAGAGHSSPDHLYYSARPEDVAKAGREVPRMNCNEGPRSRFPSYIFLDAMLQNLEQWTENGVAPPHAAPIAVENGEPVLDEHGNVTGGLRSPYLDVPTSTWYGNSTPDACHIAGHEVPFSRAELAALYPTHGAYVTAVSANTRRLVAGRTITPEDGRALMHEAAAADVP
ncbi:alpha/beta hydrolase domain-containing protein [Streptomyces sp. NPDC001275]